MMYKAKYISRFQKGNDVFLTYEYRGETYEVHENKVKGNEPLSWQHKQEQDYIDKILSLPVNNATEHAQVGLDLFFSFFE